MNDQTLPINQVNPKMKENSIFLEYFDSVYNLCHSASKALGNSANKYIKVNGFSIQLSFCGHELVKDIMPAFDHLECKQCLESDLTVFLMDGLSTHTEMPPIPWRINEKYISGEIWRYDDETLMLVYHPANKTIMLLDRARNLAIYWLYDTLAVPYHDKASPLRLILQRWMITVQCQVVHAGAVGFQDGGVLLVGKSGSGKSNTTLNCLNSDLLYVGDDYCLINENPYPCVYSLYNSGKLHAHDIVHFPSLKSAMSNKGQLNNEKALYFFQRIFPEKMLSGFPLRAILVPEITSNVKTIIRKTTPAKGFLAIAPHTTFHAPKAEQPVMNKYLDRFVRKLPNYILELGTDRSQVPGVIIELINSLK